MAADDDGDDLVAGEANRCQSGTELMAGTEAGQIAGGNLFVLHLVPGALMPDVDHIAGLRAEGFGPHGSGVIGEGKVPIEGDLVPGGTGVAGVGAIGVRGDGANPDGAGVVGVGSTGVRGEGLAWHDEGDPSQGGVGLDGVGTIGVRGYGLEAGGEFSGHVPVRLRPGQLSTGGVRSVDAYEHQLTDPRGQLPAKALAGSLFAAVTDDRACSLWFCVSTGTSRDHPAHWREVLLGTEWPPVGHDERL